MAFSVSYIYELVDKYSSKMAKIGRATQAFQNGLRKTRTGLNKVNAKFASLQGVIVSTAGVMAASRIGRTFLGFEQAMNKLESVTLGTGEEMARLRAKAKDLGETTQFSASQVGNAMVYLAQAGLDTNKVLEAIPGTLQLAAAGSIDLSSAADIATNVLAQMKFPVKELSRVNDVLSLTQARANTNILELFEAMRPVAPTAKNLGIELEQLTAYLGTMANAGEKGSIAGTLLRNALTAVAGASKSQRRIYKHLGINLKDFVDSTGKLKNFTGFIAKLRDLQDQGRLTVPILQKLFGERGFRAMQLLAGSAAGEIANLDKQLSKAKGTAQKMALIQMKGLPGVVKAIVSVWEAIQIALFESGFADMVVSFGKNFVKVLRSIVKTNPALLKFIAVVGSMLVVLGPVVVSIGFIAGALSALISPVGLIVAAVVALIAIFVTLYFKSEKIRKAFGKLWEAIKGLFAPFKPLITLLKKIFGVADIGGGVIDMLAWYITMLAKAINFVTKPMRVLADLWDRLFKSEVADKVFAKFRALAEFFGYGGADVPAGGGSVSASKNAMSASLNGNIQVSASGGASVNSAVLSKSIPGNLGFNLGKVGAY